jgi:hypothetical protein
VTTGIRTSRARTQTDPEPRDLGELTRNVVELTDAVEHISQEFGKLEKRFTLFFGLGIGAMASSGIISGAAAALLKAVAGTP